MSEPPADDPVIAAVSALPPLREVIAAHDLAAKRSLGQNFLLDLNLTRRIARSAGDLTEGTVVEIGPGPGGLTRALLLEGAREVVAVERDDRSVAALAGLVGVSGGRLRIVADDAMKIDAAAIGAAPRRIVANLPYNIATRLITGWLAQGTVYQSIVVMVQKEVAARLASGPGSKDYGRLSVFCQWLATVEPLFDVPPRAFTPAPKVTSTVVRLIPRAAPAFPAEQSALEAVTAAAFAQRRKMLRASLRGIGGEALLVQAGIEPTARPEDLELETFCRLARTYAERSGA